jgi:hypothetical protein
MTVLSDYFFLYGPAGTSENHRTAPQGNREICQNRVRFFPREYASDNEFRKNAGKFQA